MNLKVSQLSEANIYQNDYEICTKVKKLIPIG